MTPHMQDSLAKTTYSIVIRTFSINALGPLLLTQALRLMSSRVVSVADDSSGGSFACRASKAAPNSVGKSTAVHLKQKGVLVVLMHPRTVKERIRHGWEDVLVLNTPDSQSNRVRIGTIP